MKLKNNSLFEKLAPIMLVAIIVLAFGFGILWQKVENLGTVAGTTTTTTGTDITQTPTQPTVTQDQIKQLFESQAIKFGNPDSKVLFVEVADPSCPYCSAAAGLNPELNNQMGPQFKLVSDGGTYVSPVIEMKKLVDAGKAAYTYVYFPGHRNGDMAMKAMYCANEKGKFWEAHDLLMAGPGYNLINNTVLNDKTKSGELAEFLKSAVGAADMKTCLDSGKYDAVLTADTALAQSLGVQGTPGFFVNTKTFAGAYSWTDMKSAVDGLIN